MRKEIFRIDPKQSEKLGELADISGLTVSWMVKQGIELFLTQEWPFRMINAKELNAELDKKRQAVATKKPS